MARRVPEKLTLISSDDRSMPGSTSIVVVDDELGELIITAWRGGDRIIVSLTEEQVKKLQARINKYQRDNR